VGPQGSIGPQGTAGTNGAQGSTGATGATGPAGSGGVSEYAYIYNIAAQTVAIDAPVLFDSNGTMTTGFTHATGNAGITVVTAGTYKFTYSLAGTEPNQMALFVDGTVVPGSIYGSGAGTQPSSGFVIAAVPAGAVLTLRNYSSAAAVGLASVIGGTQANTNASVAIEKLG
jgi:BclA C-terminal domain